MEMIHKVQNKIYEAIVQELLYSKLSAKEMKDKFIEEQYMDSRVFEIAKNIVNMVEENALDNQF